MIGLTGSPIAYTALNLFELHPSYKHAKTLLQGPLNGMPVYLYGGLVRDAMINVLHDGNRTGKDIDLLVDDTQHPIDQEALANSLGAERSFFGCVRYHGVDIIPFRDKKGARTSTLSAVLASTDLTTVAAAVDIHSTILWDHAALDAHETRVVDINDDTDRAIPNILISRVAKEALSLDYRIGEHTQQTLREVYTQTAKARMLAHYAKKRNPLGQRIVSLLEESLSVTPRNA